MHITIGGTIATYRIFIYQSGCKITSLKSSRKGFEIDIFSDVIPLVQIHYPLGGDKVRGVLTSSSSKVLIESKIRCSFIGRGKELYD